LKDEVERRSWLNERLRPPQKAHRPIMIGSNASVTDDLGKCHFRLIYKSNEFRIHYHDYHEFRFHNCLLVMVSGSWNENFSRYCVIK
jgi:hypothetical protein